MLSNWMSMKGNKLCYSFAEGTSKDIELLGWTANVYTNNINTNTNSNI